MINRYLNLKPSDLPTATVISAPHPFIDLAVPWYRNEGGRWEEIGADNPFDVHSDNQDKELEDFIILAVPPSFYGEFESVPQGGPYEVNRAGWVKYKDMMFFNRIFVTYGGFEQTIEEAVRKAFA